MPSPREAALLAFGAARPVLQSETINMTGNMTGQGTPLELWLVIYPSTRVALMVEPGG